MSKPIVKIELNLIEQDDVEILVNGVNQLSEGFGLSIIDTMTLVSGILRKASKENDNN